MPKNMFMKDKIAKINRYALPIAIFQAIENAPQYAWCFEYTVNSLN